MPGQAGPINPRHGTPYIPCNDETQRIPRDRFRRLRPPSRAGGQAGERWVAGVEGRRQEGYASQCECMQAWVRTHAVPFLFLLYRFKGTKKTSLGDGAYTLASTLTARNVERNPTVRKTLNRVNVVRWKGASALRPEPPHRSSPTGRGLLPTFSNPHRGRRTESRSLSRRPQSLSVRRHPSYHYVIS